MGNIQKHQLLIPNFFSKALFANIENEDSLQLVIRIEDYNINIKDFSTYLHFIYKVDGILSEFGLLSYSRLYDKQLKISKVEHGSIEILIEKLFSEFGADRLIIIWLALKYIPEILNAGLNGIHKFYDTLLRREEYFEKRDRRKIRKEIRDLINDEIEIQNLDKKAKLKLVDLIDGLYIRNSRILKSTAHFSSKKVKSVKLRVKKKNNN